MDIEDFAEACQRLSRDGFHVANAQYQDQVFGSWSVELRSRRRVVWDGKEGWIVVQARNADEWEDIWLGRNAAEQTVDRAIRALKAAGS